MPNGESPAKTRNWYKVATLVLSALMIIIMFISGIHYKRMDDKLRRQDKIENKIEKLLQHKAQLQAVPKVDVALLTLEQSGLPESAFRSLAELPAVVRVRHAGGGTVKGVSVEIESGADILNYVPETSVEKCAHSISEDKRRLRLEIPQLRRGSMIQGTIMCARVCPLTHSVRIDTGMLIDPKKLGEPDKPRRYLSRMNVEKIDPTSVSSQTEIDSMVEDLRMLQRFERDRGLLDGTPTFLRIISSGFIPLLVFFSIVLLIEFIRGKKGNELGNRIGKCIYDDTIKEGMPTDEVERLLGPPRRITVDQKKSNRSETWSYVPKASPFFGWQPDAFVTFEDGTVVAIEYKEYGKKTYS